MRTGVLRAFEVTDDELKVFVGCKSDTLVTHVGDLRIFPYTTSP